MLANIRVLKRALVIMLAVMTPLFLCATADGQSFNEAFDTPIPAGWSAQNNSSPVGTSGWFAGNTLVFSSHAGAATAYAGANFNSGSGTATISNWLIGPNKVFRNGDTIRFYTRTVTGAGFPDRLQVRLSNAADSVRVGSTATSVGDFTTLLLDINPTYTTSGFPAAWTLQTVTISGLAAPTSGRFAFRYFVENAGPLGVNSDYIGIDTLTYTSLGPTAAQVSVSGRVLAIGGGGLANAFVYLTEQNGNVRSVRTGAFGYFRFDDVEAGQTVVLSVRSKRYNFEPMVLSLSESAAELEFVPNSNLPLKQPD